MLFTARHRQTGEFVRGNFGAVKDLDNRLWDIVREDKPAPIRKRWKAIAGKIFSYPVKIR